MIYHIQQYFSLMREVYCGVRYEVPLKKMVEDVYFDSSSAWLEDRIQVKWLLLQLKCCEGQMKCCLLAWNNICGEHFSIWTTAANINQKYQIIVVKHLFSSLVSNVLSKSMAISWDSVLIFFVGFLLDFFEFLFFVEGEFECSRSTGMLWTLGILGDCLT